MATALVALAVPAAASADQWWKTDTHVHSSAVSGDAPQDIGIISDVTKQEGFNAIFLSDHTAAGTQPIGGVTSNHIGFDEGGIGQWSQDYYTGTGPPPGGSNTTVTTAAAPAPASAPAATQTLDPSNTYLCELGHPETHTTSLATTTTLNSTSNEIVSMPVNTGAQSLHLASTNSQYGESFVWLKRGPNLHSGDITLKFSVDPTRIDAGSGLYVSASIGGDETIPGRPPNGYTPQGGQPDLSKHVVLVWQIGNPRVPSSDPEARVITHNLSYLTNTWNTYTINVSQAIRDEIPAADQPTNMDALTSVKMAAAANNGTADGYFDTFSMDASQDQTQGQEFVGRNQVISQYDTSNYKIYPSEEMGYNKHVQRFNAGYTSPSQFTVNKNGPLGILATQQSGYPTQVDHPGLPGGVTQAEALSTLGEGAESIEAAERGETGFTKDIMVDTWDGILKQGTQILGSWSSDAHRPDKFGQALYLLAPTMGFDDLMRAFYEGDSYMGMWDFTGRPLITIPGESSSRPYPARYPIYVAANRALERVRFHVTDGLQPGWRVVWTVNGNAIADDNTSGSSYDVTKSIPLSGSFTYVRAEVRDNTNARIAMSQPIMFVDSSPSLPDGMFFHVAGVTTPTGNNYTKIATKGITSNSWDGTSKQLTLGLTNPAGSLVELAGDPDGMDPTSVTVDGTSVPKAATETDFDAATGSSWWFDSTSRRYRVKAKQTGGTATVAVGFGPGPDTQPPGTPTELRTHALDSSRIDLSWTPPAGDVFGYTVYRDGVAVDIEDAGTTTFHDTSLQPGTHYTYTVDAFDLADNHSPQSFPAAATTDSVVNSTYSPVADAYVDSSHPTTKYGTQAMLRVDGGPSMRSYLRFDVAGLTGPVARATLRVYANSNSAGHDAHGASNTWDESTINWSNSPAPSPTVVGSAHSVTAPAWTSVDVTPLIPGNGTSTVAIDSQNETGVNYSSRESANPPQLVVEQNVAQNDPPAAADRTLTTSMDTQGGWLPDVSDPDADPVTCTIATPPSHGTATVASDCSAGTYTPNTSYTGPDSFTYRASDSSGASSTGTVSITVTPPNRAPFASNATLTASPDNTTNWSPSVWDPDGDPVTCSIVAGATHGQVTVSPDCTTGTYMALPGYTGPDSFTYKAVDSHGAESSVATVTVTVGNSSPTATNRTLSTTTGTQASWTPSVSDPDGGDTVTCSIVSAPAHGTATVASDCSSGSYTPASGYNGSDSFTYKATDNHGADSSAATVSATVSPPNHAPSASDRTINASSGAAASWTPSVSDPDAGDTLTCSIVSQPAHGTATVSSDCSGGTYTSSSGYTGADSFTYKATDSHGSDSSAATVSATVTPPNHTPTATGSSVTTTAGVATSWTPSVSDADSGDTITCSIASSPAHGTATVASDCSSGNYTPSPGYSGPDSFTYRATDNHGASSGPATIGVTVNAAPTMTVTTTFNPTADSYVSSGSPTSNFGTLTALRIDGSPVLRSYLRFAVSGLSGTVQSATLKVLANTSTAGHDVHSADSSWGETTINYNNAPTPSATTYGSAGTTAAGAWTSANVTSLVTGNSTYTMTLDAKNSTAVNYASREAASQPQLVVTTLVPLNRAPSAGAASLTTVQGTAGSWTPSASDPDVGDSVTCSIVSQPANGTATVAPDCSSGTYTPSSGYTGSDPFTYKATDNHGLDSAPATVSATVNAPNNAPAAVDRTVSTTMSTQGSWTPSVSDSDSGDTLSCSIVSQPSHGTATVAPDCSAGTYTPSTGYTGADSFTYKATDNRGADSNTATVNATVNAPNNAPTASDRSLTTTQGTQGSWTPSASDPDSGDTLTCSIVSQPSHGTATVSSDCSGGTYTPSSGYAGSDSFTYKATDNHGADSGTATVSATVNAPNHAPAATDRSLSTITSTQAPWTPSVSDPDAGDTLTCAIAGSPAHGTATVASDCSAGTYTPSAGYTGPDSFTYTATDNHGAVSNAATVTASTDWPTLFSDTFESGNLSAWTSSKGLTVQSAVVENGTFAARAQATNGVTYAKKTLGASYSDVTYRLGFRMDAAPTTGSVTVMRFRSAADTAIAGLYLTSSRKLGIRNDVAATSKNSTTATLNLGQWYTLEMHAIVNGASSTLDVKLNGTKVADISSSSTNLGTAGIGMLQIGENASGSAYTYEWDDVIAQQTGGLSTGAALHRACAGSPSLSLSAAKRQKLGRDRKITVFAVSRAACAVTAVARSSARLGGRTIRSGTVKRLLRPGARQRITLSIPRAGVARVARAARRRPVRFLVVVTGDGGGGARAVAKKYVWVRG